MTKRRYGLKSVFQFSTTSCWKNSVVCSTLKSAYLLKNNRPTGLTLRFLLIDFVSKGGIQNCQLTQLVQTCLMDFAGFVLGFQIENNKVSRVKVSEKAKMDANLHKDVFSNSKIIHFYFWCLLVSG